ncbi:MAG: glycosyltransferase family 39 protein [Candidatus Melainabacteria bacterium]|jgi:4-amino-4-deoxy-L-arabinose transferase-like glycosyltransferase|nr:glycosyltransferase family 39 protein [Candidatus Melainabacteria bacterium]
MKRLFGIFIIAFIFLLYKIWAYPLIDADEPRYAEAAKEMINAQQYLIPLADGEYRFDKPILFYWFEILSFKVFGINEFAARLPSVIAGALTVSFVYWLGHFYKVGLAAALVLITGIEFFVVSRMSITDSLLNFAIVSVLIIYFLIKEKHINERYIYLLAVCAALGFLTKGPIAILIPVMVGSIDFIINKGWKNYNLPALGMMLKAFLLFLVIAAPWYIAIHLKTGGEFTHYFFIGQNLGRFSSTLSGHHQPWWFYIAVMIIGFMPWSLFLPAMIADFKLKADSLRLQSFALIWLITVLGFFSFSSTKLANYVMSMFVPLAILFAIWFKQVPKKKWLVINSSFYIVLFCAVAFIYSQGYLDKLIASEPFLKEYFSGAFVYVALLLLLVSFGAILINALANNVQRSMSIFAVFALSLCLAGIDYFIRPFAHYKEAGIKSFLQELPSDAQIYLLTIDRPSVSFYSLSDSFPERVGMKVIKTQIDLGNKFCVIAKHDKADKLASLERLIIWSQDDIYLFTCSFR